MKIPISALSSHSKYSPISQTKLNFNVVDRDPVTIFPQKDIKEAAILHKKRSKLGEQLCNILKNIISQKKV